MKLLLEVLISLLLHPLAMVLMWINLISRSDLEGNRKLIWFIVSLVWGLGPILYILIDNGGLW